MSNLLNITLLESPGTSMFILLFLEIIYFLHNNFRLLNMKPTINTLLLMSMKRWTSVCSIRIMTYRFIFPMIYIQSPRIAEVPLTLLPQRLLLQFYLSVELIVVLILHLNFLHTPRLLIKEHAILLKVTGYFYIALEIHTVVLLALQVLHFGLLF